MGMLNRLLTLCALAPLILPATAQTPNQTTSQTVNTIDACAFQLSG